MPYRPRHPTTLRARLSGPRLPRRSGRPWDTNRIGKEARDAQPRLDLRARPRHRPRRREEEPPCATATGPERASGSPVPAVAGCGRGASAPRTAPGDQSVAGVRRPGPASTDGTDTARADGVGAAGVGEAEGGIGATAI